MLYVFMFRLGKYIPNIIVSGWELLHQSKLSKWGGMEYPSYPCKSLQIPVILIQD